MEKELGGILGREVDLVFRSDVERSRNYLRREAVLKSAEVFMGRDEAVIPAYMAAQQLGNSARARG